MNIPFVDLHQQYLSIKDEIDGAIAAVIRDSAFIRGPQVDEFERHFAAMIGTEHCVSCANGTDALYVAMQALGVGPGDEIITTAHSWISTSETITQTGARVVFCDTEPDYFCIDPGQIEELITEKTKGIIVVHLYGQAADMDPIMALAEKRGLWVIEDCAQSHLATYKGRRVGTFGIAATFSFYPGKNLGAMGDAGCLVTNDAGIAGHATLYARHGGKGDHKIEGINSRLDGLQAAVLNVKLPYLDGWTSRRRAAAARYDELLSEIPGITVPARRNACEHVYHLYVIQTEERDGLRQHLADNGVATVINYPKALPYYEAYRYLDHSPEDFPVAHRHMSRILSLPIFPELTSEQMEYVVANVAEFQGKAAVADA